MKTRSHSRTNRILVRGTNWVGDAVMTLPALSALRQNFPNACITVLGRPWVLPVYAAHSAVDRLMAYETSGGVLQALKKRAAVIREIRRRHFDLAILFQNAFEAALTAFLGGVPRRVGYDSDGRRPLLTLAVRRRQIEPGRHQVYYYLSMLAAAGWRAAYQAPALRVSAADGALAESRLAGIGVTRGDTLVALCPGAIYGPTKRWPPDRFARVGDWAARRWNARVILLGSAGEAPICAGVARAMERPAVDLCGGLPLGAAMSAIRRCRLVVSNDSGLMHVAAALGVPTVAVFGSTDPVATGPLGPHTRVVQHPTHCAPCFLRDCPLDFGCMLGVTPEMVWEAMTEIF